MTKTLTVPTSGERLDRWLASQLPAESRSTLQRWIKSGHVRVDDGAAKVGQRLEAGQRVTISPPPPVVSTTLLPEALPLDIRFEDDDLLIINKAAGMVVHPAPGNPSGTLVNALLHYAPDIEGVGGERRPGIVHRLDKETSGLIVVAKHDRAHRYLQAQFKQRSVIKEYTALVDGWIEPPAGRINAPIGRHPTARKRMAVLLPHPATGKMRGRAALTEFETVARYAGSATTGENLARFSLLRVLLHTGRTHQIRVHLAWHKFPITGDTLYGYNRRRLPIARHFLHAAKLTLALPSTETAVEFSAPLPEELQRQLDALAAAV